jgi:thiaminase/transcriptional activator TenA
MKWSETAWNEAKPIYNRILELPFIKEIIEGTLEQKRFNFYIQQDALYLADYGRILAAIGAKLKKPEHTEAFLHFAGDSVAVEKALHESFLSKQETKAIASPGCLLYTSYLFRQLADQPVEVALAAVLPCFRIYKEVGDHILEHQNKKDNPYRNWIDTYGGKDFEKSVNLAISICDEIADKCTEEQRQAMTEAYVMCSRMEWIFWDSTYRMEQWEV